MEDAFLNHTRNFIQSHSYLKFVIVMILLCDFERCGLTVVAVFLFNCVLVCMYGIVAYDYVGLEQTSPSFDIIATPLGHPIEFGAIALQDRVELDIRKMTLEFITKKNL